MKKTTLNPFINTVAVFALALLSGMSIPAQAQNLWTSATSSSWMTVANWTTGLPTGTATVGINMSSGALNNGANNEAVGAVEATSARTTKLTIGNSSSTGHVSYFKYNYVVNSAGKDPGNPDINWACDGTQVPQ